MAIGIAGRFGDNAPAIFSNGNDMMPVRSSLNRMQCDLYIAGSAVLESDRASRTRSEFAMYLTFRSSCPDRCPADEVIHVGRGDRIQVFGSGRHTHFVNFREQHPRRTQALVQVARSIHGRVVHQALPADGGSRLGEIGAHHDFQMIAQFLARTADQVCVGYGSLRIMD